MYDASRKMFRKILKPTRAASRRLESAQLDRSSSGFDSNSELRPDGQIRVRPEL